MASGSPARFRSRQSAFCRRQASLRSRWAPRAARRSCIRQVTLGIRDISRRSPVVCVSCVCTFPTVRIGGACAAVVFRTDLARTNVTGGRPGRPRRAYLT
ncbi:hypothetical protein GCM10012286_31710 [Streptomyces lasiicapitis]|uniref:Uncharacterized protein n=1 Tax=Streptomyces lasiicapitis TaxID=1923961 RepID=A0ABQ2LZC3_9ACTN|nr:hypothetical protein GCM10012286_31710 [Streptomyces lasiicapitis]